MLKMNSSTKEVAQMLSPIPNTIIQIKSQFPILKRTAILKMAQETIALAVNGMEHKLLYEGNPNSDKMCVADGYRTDENGQIHDVEVKTSRNENDYVFKPAFGPWPAGFRGFQNEDGKILFIANFNSANTPEKCRAISQNDLLITIFDELTTLIPLFSCLYTDHNDIDKQLLESLKAKDEKRKNGHHVTTNFNYVRVWVNPEDIIYHDPRWNAKQFKFNK